MSRPTVVAIALVVVAVLLHLGAHVGLASGEARTALPEDGPALVQNDALDATGEGGLSHVLSRIVRDPAAAWQPAGEIVTRTRFRPLSTAVLALERHVGRGGTLPLAGWIGLALHVLVVLGAAGLARDLGARRGSAAVAGLIVAAAPAALVAAAWPARQGLVLATALGIAGLRLARRAGFAPTLAAGVLVALSAAAHELGAGLALAAAVLAFASPGVRAGTDSDVAAASSPPATLGARWTRVAACVVPTAAFLAWRASVLPDVPIPQGGPDVFDGLVGALATLAAPLLPGSLHVAPGPWTAGAAPRLLAGAVLIVCAIAFARRSRTGWAVAGLAAIVATSPVVLAARAGGAPFQLGYSYVVLPLVAAALVLAAESAGRRGRALRIAGVVALALLVGASVRTTLAAAPVFRSGAALTDRAVRDAPDAVVPAAWRLGARIRAAGADAAALDALAPEAVRLAERLSATDGAPTAEGAALVGDGVASITVASVLAEAAHRLASVESDDDEAITVRLFDAERIAAAAATAAPGWRHGWDVLARVRSRQGAAAGALLAVRRASALAPADLELAELEARIALLLGRTSDAVVAAERAAPLEEAAAAREKRAIRREHLMLRARVFAEHAAADGILVAFDWAATLVQPLFDEGDRERDMAQLLYDIYLRWGDALVSIDRTAMGRLAYRRAEALGGTRSDAAEHLRWLEERLEGELREAQAELTRATQGEGNVANALLQVAVVLCRSARWDEADELFRRIEQGQGGMNAPLRLQRAIHRYGARDDSYEQAVEELRLVLEEAPELVEARYHIAGLLAQIGRLDEAAAAYRRAARDGAAYEWSAEAIEAAVVLEDVLNARGGR